MPPKWMMGGAYLNLTLFKFNSCILPPKVWRARADGVLGRPGQMVVAVKTLRGNDKLCSLRQYENECTCQKGNLLTHLW